MSLLLSYYDAYWHDDFVPDDIVPDNNADNNLESMGVIDTNTGEIISDFHLKLENNKWKTILDGSGINPKTAAGRSLYGDFIDNYCNEYFNIYLTDLAIKQNLAIYDMLDFYGILGETLVNFLEFYLYEKCHFTEEQVTVHKMSAGLPNGRYDMFNQAVSVINSGFPVIYLGFESAINENEIPENIQILPISNITKGHYLLGYDIIDTDVVLSPCHNDEALTSFSQTDYKYTTSIIWLEINEEAFPHVCSTSYVDANDPNRTFCTCEIYRNHPNHVDSINNGAELCPVASENAICLCGRSMSGTHRYYMRQYNEYQHWFECPCGAMTTKEMHVKNFNEILSNTHSWTCTCGYMVFDEPHSPNNCIMLNASYHSGTCSCGRTIVESHTLVDDIIAIGVKKCIDCNYTKKITGGNENVHLGVEDNSEEETD